MEKFIEAVGAVFVVVVGIAALSVISGTILWGTWDALHKIIPQASFLPTNPSWWTLVKFSWLVSTVSRMVLPNVKIKKDDD